MGERPALVADHMCRGAVARRCTQGLLQARLHLRGPGRMKRDMTETVWTFLTSHAGWLAALAGAGAVAGLIAGLFGVGGGLVIVPTLFYLLTAQGFGDVAMHTALGTSLATIVVTSVRSTLSHQRRGHVDWSVLRAWTPPIILGTLAGSQIAALLPARELTIIFGVVLGLLAMQLGLGQPGWRLASDLPGGAARWGLGAGLGGLSAIMGIGGGTLGVSLMTLCGRPIHQAVGTAAGFGAAIGLPGALGYAFAGFGQTGLAPGSLGYVNLFAFALISLFTVSLAPVGAWLAHRLPARRLRLAFAVMLAIVAIRMTWQGLTSG